MSKSLTGGVLNRINELYRCNSKANSVPIMELIRKHKPKQRDELVSLITAHTTTGKLHNCKCGVKSAGTIETFGDNLYKANLDYFKDEPEKAKTLDECVQFMYNLFVVQSLKGDMMEDKAFKALKDNDIRMATEDEDFKLGVDLVIKKGDKFCGVQVKPESYKNLPSNSSVALINRQKNEKFGAPVFYLYYNIENNFTNLDAVKAHIANL